ncbi:TetR family transcriptional regulator [Mycolicibacter minnesotensis]|uniref:TetR family transcriptional regulator n=1 Tax=Mycolicibacter minnesotensis TaxID=1118379 RepID=A0A7I7R2A9_9MYCO|nr:TetR/AcrR family transcriptional regulator [Mycolicibacter minnesotensis]ORB02577.1 TetR family transcriptional regulator [Mycolicibacter minnesotensis]BBY32771.1 putative transcriptional regulator, TetR family protein [Mycolicibacter minnesotensis]
MVETTTRDRLVNEAMRLFSEQGYRATSVAQIEKAAGLAPGSGALYHHFKSKEALLAAGIDRQLDRRGAMRDVRALFAGLGDLDTELTLLGRYLFAVLDEETQLLQIAARTPADQSARVAAAYAALVDGLCAELADWIAGWAPHLAAADAQRIAVVAVNALLGNRAGRMLYRGVGAQLADEEYLSEWTTLLAVRIRA